MEKCKGSGESQMLAWFPDNKSTEEFPKGYPGAVVCNGCTFGVLVYKTSVHKAVSMTGVEGLAGKVRTHYVSKDGSQMSYRKDGR